MLFKSSLLAEASGSIGGTVYSHNKGGMYTRNRSLPTNPNTARQQQVRAALGQCVTAWNGTLTSAQRDNWATFAANVPVVNRLGDPRTIPALAWFNKANQPRIANGKALVAEAPSVYSLGALTAPTLGIVATTKAGTIGFTNTDAWAIATGGHLFLQCSRPQSSGVNFFKGPYATAAIVNGAVSPPTSPSTFTYAHTLAAGQRVFYRFVASQADGRPTNVWEGFCVAS